MRGIEQTQSSDFFGKDGLTTFIGKVEDVKDPKGAARVRVRCVGWHPKDKNDLATDELPWSRVSAPTTHAQQGRVGSKHGLLPGCWVWGFFLDGGDAQNPMVCGSFPFTAGVSDSDNRVDVEGQESSTEGPEIKGMAKTGMPMGNNSGTKTLSEVSSKNFSHPTDKAGDAPSLEDSMDKECGERKSASKEARDAEYSSPENVEGQDKGTTIGDGGCGNVPWTQVDVQKLMKEKMPSLHNRMVHADAVWDAFSGAYMNLNGIMNQNAMDICSILKMLLTQQKGFIEETINRPARAIQLLAGTTRDSTVNIVQDDALTIKDDMMNAMMMQFLDSLCGMLMDMLRAMDESSNNDGGNGAGNNGGGGRGSRSGVGVGPGMRDPGSQCVSEAIVFNALSLSSSALTVSLSDAQRAIVSLGLNVNTNPNRGPFSDLSLTDPELNGWGDYDPDEIRARTQQMFDEAETEGLKEERDARGADNKKRRNEDFMSEFGNILSQLGSISSLMSLSSNNKYAIVGSFVHNKAGNQSNDKRIKDGACKMERVYNTVRGLENGMGAALAQFGDVQGALGAFGGIAGAGSGGGTGGEGTGRGSFGDGTGNGSNNSTQLNKTRAIGPGGLSQDKILTYSTDVCDEAGLQPVCFGERPSNRTSQRWNKTEITVARHIPRLRGEKTINKQKTNKSRVLLRNQNNPTENGVWVTSKREWKRASDANRSKEFTNGKFIIDGTQSYEYIGENNPVIDRDPIIFRESRPVSDTTKTKPCGRGARVIAIGVPSGEEKQARNYKRGVPNTIIVKEPGKGYYNEDGTFPSIYIPDYNGTPIPIVDPVTGGIVGIITHPDAWNPSRPNVPISIIPDNSPIGIVSDDDNYDLEVGGIVVMNTGRGYTNPKVEITNTCTGEAVEVTVRTVEGRVVEIGEINNAGRCSQAPTIKVSDATGYGAKLFPIMNTIPKPNSIAREIPVEMIFCPGKNQRNLI